MNTEMVLFLSLMGQKYGIATAIAFSYSGSCFLNCFWHIYRALVGEVEAADLLYREGQTKDMDL